MFILVNYCQFWLNTNTIKSCLFLLILVNRSLSCRQAPVFCSAPSSWSSCIWWGSSTDGPSCGVTRSLSPVRAASRRCPHGPLRPPRRTNKRHSCELTHKKTQLFKIYMNKSQNLTYFYTYVSTFIYATV